MISTLNKVAVQCPRLHIQPSLRPSPPTRSYQRKEHRFLRNPLVFRDLMSSTVVSDVTQSRPKRHDFGLFKRAVPLF